MIIHDFFPFDNIAFRSIYQNPIHKQMLAAIPTAVAKSAPGIAYRVRLTPTEPK